jgi:hypothetical protein
MGSLMEVMEGLRASRAANLILMSALSAFSVNSSRRDSLSLAVRLTRFVIDSVNSHVSSAEKGKRVGKGPGHDFRRALVSWAVRVIRQLDARRTSQPE